MENGGFILDGSTRNYERTEAGMYRVVSKIIMDGSKRYKKETLDELLNQASNN